MKCVDEEYAPIEVTTSDTVGHMKASIRSGRLVPLWIEALANLTDGHGPIPILIRCNNAPPYEAH
jgi:hypothetical protein